MNYIPTLISIAETIVLMIPVLFTVAFITVAERKTMASMQRRVGPNLVGYYGLLQAFADALKLLLKEYVSPTQANIIIFFIGPVLTLIFSLLAYAVIPFAPGIDLTNINLGLVYILAVSSISTYGILLAGWSANSKYAFLGSLRSTAQLISYELILSSALLVIIFITGSLNLTTNVEYQRAIWFIAPLFPLFCIFFIGSVAETNRAPFDLAEAESELVSGFMTEHSSVVFVFFFLAEYASILLMSILISILFLGGYLYDYIPLNYYMYPMQFINFDLYIETMTSSALSHQYTITTNTFNAICIGIKTFIMVFIFIWVRASYPRIRFDQLMSYCWTKLLPLLIALIVLIPCSLYALDIIPNNIIIF